MNEGIETFLSSRLPIGGLVAYTIQSPNRVLATQCLSKSLYPSAAEQTLTELVVSCRNLLPNGESAASYCWVFECLRVHVAARADGFCLALMVENTPSAQTRRIQQTLEAFIEAAEF